MKQKLLFNPSGDDLFSIRIKNVIDEYGKTNYYYGIKKYNLENEIIEKTSFLSSEVSIRERFYYIIHNIREVIKCGLVSCNKSPNFKNLTVGHHRFCSSKCCEQYKRETINEDGVTISSLIGDKIRRNKSIIDDNGKTKGQNARQKQLSQQMKIDETTGLKFTTLVAQKGVLTLKENGLLMKRGEKIKNKKLNNIDKNGLNGYDRAARSTSKALKNKYQTLQIENSQNLSNYFLYFFICESDNVIKIGVSGDFKKRKKYLENKLSRNLNIHSLYLGKHLDILKAEKELHEFMNDYQIPYSKIDGKNEWFKYDCFLENECIIVNKIKELNMEKFDETKIAI